MSSIALFAMGTFVSLLVAAGLGLLFFAAVLDGRDEARYRAEARTAEGPEAVRSRSAA